MVEGASTLDASNATGARVRTAAFGAPAVEALADAITGAKRADPLAPVTIIVRSALVGVTVRRRLAARGGVVALDAVSMSGLALRLAGQRLAADRRRPLDPLQAAALARSVLGREHVRLASAAEHPATVEALLRTFRELRTIDAAALVRLAGSGPRAAEVVDLFRSYRRLADEWVDDHDVMGLAVEAVRAGDASLDEVGAVVLYLPRRLIPADLAVLGALHERGRLSAIVGMTGRERADGPQRQTLDQLASIGMTIDAGGDPVALSPARPSTIVRAADPAEEVRLATRIVCERLEAGVSADRIAIVSRVSSPYSLLVHEDLAAAGIPHSAPAPAQLGQSITGRALLGLLEWRVNGYRRDDLMRLLRSCPVRDPAGGRTRPDRWDRVARDAGVVGGLEQWHQRLGAARTRALEWMERARAGAGDPTLPLAGDSDGDGDAPRDHSDSGRRRVAEIDALGSFVDGLARATDPGDRRSWGALSRWARRLVHQCLGGDSLAAQWSDSEQRSRAAVLDLLDDLASLDEFESAPGPDAFRRLVEHELSKPAGRVGRFGHGVFVGRLVEAVGADLDEVIVLGCAEGVFPPRPADDPLLPDRDRRAAGGGLRPRGTTGAEEERDALAVIAGAGSSTLTFPVADPRDQHTRQPSPFVLEQCTSLLGERVDTDGVGRLRDDSRAVAWFVDLPSFEWWLADGRTPAMSTELDVREFLAARVARQPIERLPVVQAAGLERGLAAAHARVTGEFGEWSGSVGKWPALAMDLAHLRSATSLQHWATCPFRYFAGNVLGLAALEDPGDAETISAADRGSLVHVILERYFRARIEGAPADLDAIAAEAEAWLREQGRTGRPLLWDADWAALRRHLVRVLEAGEQDPRLDGVEPVAVEHHFGFTDAGVDVPPVEVDLGDGRTMRFRGAADRIDRSPAGDRLVVLDYKTGGAGGYEILDADYEDRDVVARGTLLQLPVYALAARAAFPGASEVDAYYWFIGQRGPVGMIGGAIDEEAEQRFRTVLRTIADGIEGGLFPVRPGEETYRRATGLTYDNCKFCDFDKLCPNGRGEQWITLRERDELRDYVELAEGPADDAVDEEAGAP
jgi:hypothetical protein